MEDTREMVYKTTLKKEFGLTEALIKKLGKPDEVVRNPRYRRAAPAQLYLLKRVNRFITRNGSLIEEARRSNAQRAAQKLLAPKRRLEELRGKYREPGAAIPDAANALFNLNRYAKYRCCKPDHRSEIYGLKNQFLKLLCEHGYLLSATLHVSILPAKVCHACGGSGERPFSRYTGDDDDAEDAIDDDSCARCGGTGNYLGQREVYFVCFKFSIDGQQYCWHQPKELVNWAVNIADGATPMPEMGDQKPVALRRAAFARAKSLIRFALGETTES